MIVFAKGDQLFTEKTKSVSFLVSRIVALKGERLPAAVVGLLVVWARKATAGEVIHIDRFLIARVLEKEAS